MIDVWTEAQLMGLADGETLDATAKGKGVDSNAMLWGVPGHLTLAEAKTFFLFKTEIEKRGGEFHDTIYCFGEAEGEAWALTRWLRARKYVLADVLKMVEEATECRKEAKSQDFYPDPSAALGVDFTIYVSQYPQLYTGFAKNGVPLYISKPGVMNVDGVECLTTLDGIIKYHWNVMMHGFANRLRAQKKEDPNFTRCVCYKHLCSSQNESFIKLPVNRLLILHGKLLLLFLLDTCTYAQV
jgi:hypothetical protein